MSVAHQADRYTNWRVRLRARASRYIPVTVTDYPFEVVVAFVGLLMGLPYLLGVAAPLSLLGLVGTVAFHFWAAALTLGGLTTAVALMVGDRPSWPILASGLHLSAACFGVYSAAVVIALGFSGLTAFAAFIVLSVISLVRATHFRRLIDIQKGAADIMEHSG